MTSLSPSTTLYVPRPARLTAYITSQLRSLDIDFDTVRSVLAHYGLELAGRSRNLPNARRNRNLIVNTRSGTKVLKLYRADWRMDTIAYEHSILQNLANVNFPAPRLLLTSAGNTLVTSGGKNYCMFEFVSGQNYSWAFLFRPHRMRLMRTAGRTLAQLHREMEGFIPDGNHHLGFRSYQDGRARDMNWYVEKVSDFKKRSRRINDPAAGWLVAHAWKILDDLTDLNHALKDVPLLRTIIHGDFGLHNLIFQDAQRATPMDFELARLEWRLSDLVSCLSKLRNRNGEYDTESIVELLSAYQQENPIGDEEWQSFPQVWMYYKLAKAVHYWNSYFETNGPAHKLSLAKDAVDQSVWLVNDPLTVANLRSGMKREA